MRNFRVSIDMDRIPVPNTTREVQQREVDADNAMMGHLRRGKVCGCRNCIGDALEGRWKHRGEDLTVEQSPFTLRK